MKEFIETYSDDLLYLIDFRNSHLSHPGKKPSEKLMNASLSRIFCAFMIGNIEAMIEYWKDKDANGILNPYFQNGSNEERINSLKESFTQNNILVNKIILDQYLAIKYVRNSIIHSSWNENQKEFVEKMGFPIDARDLTEIHLEKMYKVNVEMMKYIASVEHQSFSTTKLNNELPQVKRYFTKKQFIGFLWHNMEMMDYYIYQNDEIVDEITKETDFNWNLFKNLTVEKNIDLSNLDDNIKILNELVETKRYSNFPVNYLSIENMDDIENMDIKLQEKLVGMLNLQQNELKPFLIAFTQGKICYQVMINKSIERLLKLVEEKNERNNTESNLAKKLFNLGSLYYNYAEKK